MPTPYDAPMDFLSLSDRIRVWPVLHGSGDFAVEIRRRLLAGPVDCLAVPLPESFAAAVEEGIGLLPGLTAAVQQERPVPEWQTEWSGDFADDEDHDGDHDEDHDGDDSNQPSASIVPIEPCQPVIAALRTAIPERIPRAYVDAESSPHVEWGTGAADAYALRHVSLEAFDAAMLTRLPLPDEGPQLIRARHMAARLRDLEQRFERIVFVCGLAEWPAVVDAYLSGTDQLAGDRLEQRDADPAELFRVDRDTAAFLTHEFPFVAGRYEQARAMLEADGSQSIDGVKEMLIEARERYQLDLGKQARPVSPHALSVCLKYMRNLSLLERRLTPDMFTLVTAARQTVGDTFARHMLEVCKTYPYAIDDDWLRQPLPQTAIGLDALMLPDDDGRPRAVPFTSRLPAGATTWRNLDLQPEPPREQARDWESRWNPFRQCSWPPEDTAIERFRTSVKDHAITLLGHDLARTEKFTTSLKDGLDIRETLRNWHTGELYVQELPPNVGTLDCVVMLFDTPADPRSYPYRLTWHAEHHDESTMGFFATPPQEQVVGPGIALAQYGGALFLFPPRPIPEIWQDRRLDYCDTLEERLLAAGCLHSREKHVALLAPGPPGLGWRRLARRYGKRLIHVPTGRFSQQTLQQLRLFHVLNGHEVRSYAADFIRKA